MRRYALLLGNAVPPEGEGGALMLSDIASVRSFLASRAGGSWREDEMLAGMNVPKALLLVLLQRLSGYDFLLVYYSSPVGTVRDGTALRLNPAGEVLSVRQLEGVAARQVNVYDCCSVFCADGEDAGADEASAHPASSCDVAGPPDAEPYQLNLYPCAAGARTLGHPLHGGLYTARLLSALREQAPGAGRIAARAVWQSAHARAAFAVALETAGEQRASCESRVSVLR